MPPLPRNLDSQVVAEIDSVTRRLRDLEEYQIPALRACTGPLVKQQQLNAGIRDDLDMCAQQIEALEVAVEDQDGGINQRELQRIVAKFQAELHKLRQDSRSALWVSKQSIDAKGGSARDELLGSAINEKQTGDTAEDDVLMRANNDVTAALRRTMDLMQGELEKSVLSTQILEESSRSLEGASAQHDTLTLVMGTSKQLIIALEKADWLDRMLILAGLAFFGLVVLLVLKQRILDRGLRIAFWWTRFIPKSSTAQLMDKLERGALSSASKSSLVVSKTIAATASSVLTAVTASTGIKQTTHKTVSISSPSPSSRLDTVYESISSLSTSENLPTSETPVVSEENLDTLSSSMTPSMAASETNIEHATLKSASPHNPQYEDSENVESTPAADQEVPEGAKAGTPGAHDEL